MQSILINMCEKFYYDRLRNDSAGARGVATGGYRDISPKISPSKLFMG